jgi:hypothetical protein
LAIGDSLDVSLHSKINNWIALLFLAVVFHALSRLLSKLVAMFLWLQVGAGSLALLSGAIGVGVALFATFMLGNLMAEVIPMRPPLSSILMSGKRPEVARGHRIVVTVALFFAAPIVLVAGNVAESYVPEPGRSLFAPLSKVEGHDLFSFPQQLESAKSGDIVSQRLVGIRYLRGDGIQQDYGQALYWLIQAAQRGDIVASTALAEMYHEGKGAPRNDNYALALFIRAAQQGAIVAQINLADMLMAGEGGPQDVVSAYAWYSIGGTAAGSQYPEVARLASERIDALSLLITQSQIAEAQRQAAVWWANRPR